MAANPKDIRGNAATFAHVIVSEIPDKTRTNEIRRIRTVLREEVGLPLMEVCDSEAKLDGGDVLFTGREILVGQSGRTNARGLQAVKEAFPGYPVTSGCWTSSFEDSVDFMRQGHSLCLNRKWRLNDHVESTNEMKREILLAKKNKLP